MTATPQTDAPERKLQVMLRADAQYMQKRFGMPADKTLVAEAADALDASDAVIAALVKALNYMVNHAGQLERNDGIYWEATEIARAALSKARKHREGK